MSDIAHKIQTMLVIQDELNQVIDPDWQKRNFRYEDAILVEAVELFDHLPWKWWKRSTKPVDREQVKLEAIDIWHFIMCRFIERFGIELAGETLTVCFENHDKDVEDVKAEPVDWTRVASCTRGLLTEVANENEAMARTLKVYTPSYVFPFRTLLACLCIDIDELYVTYVAKTQLNRLRWENGYGTTYVKNWDGQEDNVWLAEYVKTLDVNAPDFKDQVYAGLSAKYAKVTETLTMETRNGI